MEPISNLLGLVDREINDSLEIPAYKEMIRLLKKQRLVQSYLAEQKSIRKKELENITNNKKIKRTSKSTVDQGKLIRRVREKVRTKRK